LRAAEVALLLELLLVIGLGLVRTTTTQAPRRSDAGHHVVGEQHVLIKEIAEREILG